jgi:hypothetical protein
MLESISVCQVGWLVLEQFEPTNPNNPLIQSLPRSRKALERRIPRLRSSRFCCGLFLCRRFPAFDNLFAIWAPIARPEKGRGEISQIDIEAIQRRRLSGVVPPCQPHKAGDITLFLQREVEENWARL